MQLAPLKYFWVAFPRGGTVETAVRNRCQRRRRRRPEAQLSGGAASGAHLALAFSFCCFPFVTVISYVHRFSVA